MAVAATMILTARTAVIFLASLVVLPQKLDPGLKFTTGPSPSSPLQVHFEISLNAFRMAGSERVRLFAIHRRERVIHSVSLRRAAVSCMLSHGVNPASNPTVVQTCRAF